MRLDRRTRKRIGWGMGILLLGLLLFLAFRPSPIPVETGLVTRGPLEITVDADGVTRVADRYEIATPVTGRLERIQLEEGDAVGPGSLVARITPAPLDPQAAARAQAAVSAAEARIEEANARIVQTREAMEMARRSADRIAALVREGGMSIQEGEQAELEATTAAREYEAALSRAEVAASDLVAARAALVNVDPEESSSAASVDVRAPAAGRVLRIYQQSERVVPAGTPILEVGNANRLEVVVDVLSTDAVRIDSGNEIRIVEWGGEGILYGTVRQVEPAAFTEVSSLGVAEQRVNIIGDLVDTPAALGDGYRIEASIVLWSASDVVRVPSSALFQTTEGWRVFVIADRRARLREVEIGQRGVTETQVLAGLQPGEEVILFPSDELTDGARVRPEP